MTLFYSIPLRFFSCWNAHLKFNNRYPPKSHIWKEIHFPRPISFGTSYLCKTFDHLTRFVKIGQQLQENYGIESLSRIVWSLEIGSWDALPSLEPTSPMKTGQNERIVSQPPIFRGYVSGRLLQILVQAIAYSTKTIGNIGQSGANWATQKYPLTFLHIAGCWMTGILIFVGLWHKTPT